MKRLLSHLLILGTLAVILASCGTSAPRYNYKELARASLRLKMDIDMKDNHQLYVESAGWLGVPYRGGGNSKRGVDCPRTYIKRCTTKNWNETRMTNVPKTATK